MNFEENFRKPKLELNTYKNFTVPVTILIPQFDNLILIEYKIYWRQKTGRMAKYDVSSILLSRRQYRPLANGSL